MSLYQLNNITHAYDQKPVLVVDRWNIDADTVTGVMGPNGSGKSTLLSLLGFITVPSNGKVQYKGRLAEPFSDRVRGRVVILPQSSFLLKRSVYNNVAYGLRMNKSKGDERQLVFEAMEMVGLEPDVFARRPWYALSGGEARRVALAARLALHPEVLLMDEPTTSVDAASAQMIKTAALHARHQWGSAMIISSHDTEWLADISNNILHLFRGRILGNGRQTLIFGPWQAENKGCYRKRVAHDQFFEAYGDPESLRTAVAAVEAKQIHLYLSAEQIPETQHCLKGMLMRLNYEQSTGRISASVLVGGEVFNAYVPECDNTAGRFNPGRDVWVGYNPRSVEWY